MDSFLYSQIAMVILNVGRKPCSWASCLDILILVGTNAFRSSHYLQKIVLI